MTTHAEHDHIHTEGSGLGLALALTAAILAVEIVGGVASRSLALFADASHVLTDLAAIGMALYAARQAHRPANRARTYGYHRLGILVAAANAGILIVIAGVIAIEAYGRLIHPQAVEPLPMMIAAAIGLGANLCIASRLHGHGAHDLNVRGALLHVISDAGAAAGVIIAAVIIAVTRWSAIDPVLSIAIALLVAVGAYRLLRDALHILMEAPPRDLDMDTLIAAMGGVPGVRDVHDLHVWSIGSGHAMLSCHVRIDDQSLADGLGIVGALHSLLADRFAIDHATIQPETDGCTTSSLYCRLPCGCCDTHTLDAHSA